MWTLSLPKLPLELLEEDLPLSLVLLLLPLSLELVESSRSLGAGPLLARILLSRLLLPLLLLELTESGLRLALGDNDPANVVGSLPCHGSTFFPFLSRKSMISMCLGSSHPISLEVTD